MTKEQLSAQLNGIEYKTFDKIIKNLEPEIKASGLLIIFGESDDLVEFRGIFDDEIGAFKGKDNIRIDSNGLIHKCHIIMEEWSDDIDDDDLFKMIKEYVKRREHSIIVSAKYYLDGYLWVIKTDIPHATFDILISGDKFCKGIVIDFKDVK